MDISHGFGSYFMNLDENGFLAKFNDVSEYVCSSFLANHFSPEPTHFGPGLDVIVLHRQRILS